MSLEGLNSLIENHVAEHYINSDDFNGILASKLLYAFKIDKDEFCIALSELIDEDLINLAFDCLQGNPHILRIPPPEKQKQIELLKTESLNSIGIYPTEKLILEKTDISILNNQPFSKRLALGEPQLTAVFFNLYVLDYYFREPRYLFQLNDFSGKITIKENVNTENIMQEKDEILLESFGIAYNANKERVIGAYLRYLSNLNARHQQIWSIHIIEKGCKLNAEYSRASLYGEWPRYYSAYEAFLRELKEINKICKLIGRRNLFKNDFATSRPEGFHPILRPTKSYYMEFILLFDKMLSENINLDFFDKGIDLQYEERVSDNKFLIKQKGTLTLLKEWLSKYYSNANGEDVSEEVIKPLKELRAKRQAPAHQISTNEYDLSYTQKQDQLISDVLVSLQKLRLIFMSHPAARGVYDAPEWLDSDRIVIY